MTAPRRATQSHLASALLLAAALSLTACSGDDGWSRGGEPSASDAFRRDLSGGMVVPRQLVIHPLSRLTVEQASRPARRSQPAEPSPVRMILHLELRDEYRQSIKSLGRFRIHIDARGDRPDLPAPIAADSATSPVPPAPPPPEETIVTELRPVPVRQPGVTDGNRQFTWALDLTDPRINARFYDDLVTRTYTIALAGLPAWVQEWARSSSASSQPPLVRVTFEFMETPPTTQQRSGAPTPNPTPNAADSPDITPAPTIATTTTPTPTQPFRVRTLRAESRVGR